MDEETRQWETAVQQAMHDAAMAEANGRLFAYRWEHVTAVVTLAQKLAALTGADHDTVTAAAWLHDIRKDAGQTHPQEGAAFARQFLPQTDFPPEKIEAVAQTIADHMGLWRDEPLTRLESQVLWDADKLAKLGLTAALHWTGWRLTSQPTTTADLIENNLAQDWQEKTVASMHTAPARQAAKIRLERFQKLWHNLQQELNGEDLA